MKFIVSLIVFFVFAGFVYAFVFTMTQIDYSPKFPEPGQEVEFFLSEDYRNKKEQIIWAKDDNLIKDSLGKTRIKLKVDKEMKVSVFFKENNQIARIDSVVKPVFVTFVKQTNAQSIFYDVSAKILSGIPMKVIAYTNQEGRFVWFLNDKKIKESSENFVDISNPQDGDVLILHIFDLQGNLIKKAGTRIKTQQPDIIIFVDNDVFFGDKIKWDNIQTIFAMPDTTIQSQNSTCDFYMNDKKISNKNGIVTQDIIQVNKKEKIKIKCKIGDRIIQDSLIVY